MRRSPAEVDLEALWLGAQPQRLTLTSDARVLAALCVEIRGKYGSCSAHQPQIRSELALEAASSQFAVLPRDRADEILLRSSLANFRDLDFHFVSPIRIDGGQSLSMDLACTEAGKAGNGSCSVAALVAGVNRKLPERS